MSEFMKRLSEATRDNRVDFVNGEMMQIPAGRTLGKIDAEREGKALPTDAREVTAFLYELGKRLDASGLKLTKRYAAELPAVTTMDDGSWLIYLDLKAKNGLAADLRAYGDRKDGKDIYFEVETIGPDASGDLPSNDPLKLHLKNLDLLDAFEEAASVAKGHAEDVLDFRKLWPDFGKGK